MNNILDHAIPAKKIINQKTKGNRVWSILLLKDWPIKISDSIYSGYYVVASWTAHHPENPNFFEKASGTTEAICRNESLARMFLDALLS